MIAAAPVRYRKPMKRLAVGAFAVGAALAVAACAWSPAAVRLSPASATVVMNTPPHKAAYCVADLADQRMRYRPFGEVNNNHVRLRDGSASVISIVLSEAVAWLVDFEATDGGSIARLHIGDRSLLYAGEIERIGRAILEECAADG